MNRQELNDKLKKLGVPIKQRPLLIDFAILKSKQNGFSHDELLDAIIRKGILNDDKHD